MGDVALVSRFVRGLGDPLGCKLRIEIGVGRQGFVEIALLGFERLEILGGFSQFLFRRSTLRRDVLRALVLATGIAQRLQPGL